MLVITYHHTRVPPKGVRYRGAFVTPRHLAFQIQCLKRLGYDFLTVAEGYKRNFPSNAVALTFDDGYEDVYTHGFPLLKSLRIPATLFVVTGDVGKKNLSWPEAGEKASFDLMSWDKIRDLHRAGWEIASHANDHVHLARKPRDAQLLHLQDSFITIKEELGSPPLSVAYPYGSFNDDTKSAASEAGFLLGLTTVEDSHCYRDNDLFALRRFAMKGYHFGHYPRSYVRLLNAKKHGHKR